MLEHSPEHIAARVTDEAGRVFDLLEPGLGERDRLSEMTTAAS
ncbi:hypothetical protein [Nocardia rhamnosiphila]|nr:hypothetical protein [Nocardia rhamnosiphila]